MVDEMPPRVKALAMKPENLSLILRTHVGEGEIGSCKLFAGLYIHAGVFTHIYIHVETDKQTDDK